MVGWVDKNFDSSLKLLKKNAVWYCENWNDGVEFVQKRVQTNNE